MDSFSKLAVEGVIWVTFVNIDTKEVLFTKRMTSKPVGFGVRNYWAGAIYKMLKQIKADYDTWKKNYK